MGLDPGKLLLTWPEQFNQAVATRQSTRGLSVGMTNDAATRTLTAQTMVAGTIASVGTGAPSNQAPPKPLLATVQPNTGQLSYAYPIKVAPGPNGTTPTVQLVYSSQNSNQRTEITSPADSPGEGWGTSMGSISMTNYPSGSALSGDWYFLSGVDNVSDRLIPTTTGSSTYYTEHVSRLKIQQVTPSGATQPCFHVWDPSGTYYEYGCTSDSLQYSTDTSGKRTNYRWDLDRIVPPNEGPGTSTRYTAVSYLQDIVTATGGATVRDAVIKQIIYGTGTSGTALSGTVDFLYKGVTAVSSNGIQWVTAYGSNEGGCQPPAGQPATTLRCDDPVDFTGGLSAPTVMSTYSLQTIKTYVGGDTYNPPQPVYSYNLATGDSAYHQCGDARTGTSEWCTGEHVLNSITPTVYQNGVGHQLPGVTFNYNGEHNYYYDSTQKVPYGNYASNTYLYYLASYHDHSNGTGEIITYQTAYNNTHGTPNSGTDNRFDPTYCYTHNTCTGSFANPGDRAWTVQVVHTVTAIGTDSSSSSLQPATTTYAYNMSIWGGTCPADSAGLTSCTGYAWYPSGEGDWQDFYHGEFHGFGIVYITSPSGDLTVEDYASTEGWGTAEGFSGNYTSGQLYEQDVYSGSTADPSRLISKTANTYAGNNSTLASCYSDSSYKAYEPCEVVLTSSRTTRYEQTGTGNINVPWVQQDNTYDDYTSSGGFGSYPQVPATGAYHNLQQQVISSSNAPTVTKKWTYDTTDTAIGGQVYYNVHQVAHSEVDDASGHVWSCQDTTYDQGVASGVPQPAAGWPTTTTSYSNCGNHAAGVTLTGYIGYNGNGQGVAAVDALGVGTPGLYSSAGCTLTTAPTYINSAWTSGHYSACTVYDVQHGMPTTQTNAFGQTTTTTYDPMQGQIPKSVIDVNGQTTAMSYSYDSSGNKTEQVKAPGETGSYTNQSQIISTCTDSSTLPCLQEDSISLQYSNAISRTFYDQQGRA
ncbi:MAG: hypothetical protein JO011_10265, partial [Ktedonobacteraceae bacterium]|nr:hypothetical protein [Ktedonobacteraceae bacterium]